MITFNLEMTARSITMLLSVLEGTTLTDATLVLNENALKQVTPTQVSSILNAFIKGDPIRAHLTLEID